MLRFALALVLLFPIAAMADITGKPRVVDGDTIHINQTKIRLHGIDAPEMKQTCATLIYSRLQPIGLNSPYKKYDNADHAYRYSDF